MIPLPNARRYADEPMAGMLITCELQPGTPIADYDPPMLDGLLAAAVVREVTGGQMLPASREPYFIPLPLEQLYVSPEGLPLWAASCLWPSEPSVRDMQYLHRRAQTGQFTAGKKGRFSVDTIKGRWMERRVPTPTVVTDALTAYCIGIPEEVERLLSMISHVGKRRAAGLGEVKAWHVEPVEISVGNLLIRDGALSRPMPIEARGLVEPFIPSEGASYVGWTPPYWLPATMADGWRAGTPVEAHVPHVGEVVTC